MRFQRFIVGRPNLVTLQIKLAGRNLNELIDDFDLELAQLHHMVDVWVTTSDYSPILEIDCRLIGHKRPFKFIDLVKLLPEGVWLHRKYDSLMHQAIATLGENYNLLLASNNFPIVDPNDPEEEKTFISKEEIMDIRNSVNPKLREELLNHINNVDLNDENAVLELQKELMSVFEDQDLGDGLPSIESAIDISEKIEKEVDNKIELNEEVIEDEEEGEEGEQTKEYRKFGEDKINEILKDLSKRKKNPKGSVVPLSAASSKKMIANKFETNTVSNFKKAQAKGAPSSGKKDKKK